MKKIIIKNILFVIPVFFPILSFCLTKEELIKKINAYTIAIINKELPAWKTNSETGKPVYDLSALKNNLRIYNFEPMLLSIRKYINEGSQQPSEEPALDLSRELLNLVTNRINSAGTPLDADLNKANDVMDKLQYADMNTDNFDKQEVLEHLRRNIVEIANYVFSLNINATDAENYMILKDDIKILKSDLDDLEDFFIKNKNDILMEEFAEEADSSWSNIKEKIMDIITQSKSDQLPKYVKNVKDLGDAIFNILKTNILSENSKSEDIASLMQKARTALNPISTNLSNNVIAIKNLKIVSLAKIQARDILVYLTSKLVSIINTINNPDTMKLAKAENLLTFEQVNEDLKNYLNQLKLVPSLKIVSMRDKNKATNTINGLKRISITIFIKLMLYLEKLDLAQRKEFEKLATTIKDLNHKLLGIFEKYYSLKTITRKAIIKDKIKKNHEKRLNIIEELKKLIKELEILKSTNTIELKNEIMHLLLMTANTFLSTINEFNKNHPIINV